MSDNFAAPSRGGRGRGRGRGSGSGSGSNGYAPYPARGAWRGGRGRSRGRGQGYGSGSGNNNNGRFRSDEDTAAIEAELRASTPASARVTRGNRDDDDDSRCPYQFWPSFFPGVPYSEDHDFIANINAFTAYFQQFFELKSECELLEAFEHLISRSPAVIVDYNELVTKTIPDFETQFKNQPLEILACLGLAATTAAQRMQSYEDGVEFPRKTVRIMNSLSITPLKDLRANLKGKNNCVS
eukprot:jgi/Hompol1/2418/HPOL_001809-RA